MKTHLIDKVGLLCIRNGKILLVYKKSIGAYITPGGKREPSETDEACIKREIKEELGCNVSYLRYFRVFTSDSLRQTCYLGRLKGRIVINPQDTITDYRWADRNCLLKGSCLAPMLTKQIIPALTQRGLL